MRRLLAALAVLVYGAFAGLGQEAPAGGRRRTPCPFTVRLPAAARPFPEPLAGGRTLPGFRLRGTKGWAWTPEQYLAEIPFLVRVKMNFLMNCYISLFTDPERLVNRWWEPLPEAKKRAFEAVARSCREHGITFCFAVHPGLNSERPFRYDSPEDFAALWRHFAWMQGLGVRWFSLSYDDIPVEGLDKAALGEIHARLANALLSRLREKDPEVQLIFCPVYYAGCGETRDARLYLEALGRGLHEDVYLFWTGDDIVTVRISAACAAAYRARVKHRLIIWDNYPVNDRHAVLHLGPVSGRDPRLAEVADGYISNPLCPQNEANRLPLSTCADFAWNPWLYDPGRSIGQAIVHLAESPAQREVPQDLVELYPGGITCGDTRTSFDSVGETFARLLAGPDGREAAAGFVARLKTLASRIESEFGGRFADARRTLAGHIDRLEAELRTARLPDRAPLEEP